jgi:hypothetical protein
VQRKLLLLVPPASLLHQPIEVLVVRLVWVGLVPITTVQVEVVVGTAVALLNTTLAVVVDLVTLVELQQQL